MKLPDCMMSEPCQAYTELRDEIEQLRKWADGAKKLRTDVEAADIVMDELFHQNEQKDAQISRLTTALQNIHQKTADAKEGTLLWYIHNRAYIGLNGEEVDKAQRGDYDYHRGDGDEG